MSGLGKCVPAAYPDLVRDNATTDRRVSAITIDVINECVSSYQTMSGTHMMWIHTFVGFEW